MPQVKITKSFIDALEVPNKDTFYWDTIISGFGFKITPKGKVAFILQKRTMSGRECRVSLGVFPAQTVQGARDAAQKVISKILGGYDPREEKKELKSQQQARAHMCVTFREVFDLYMQFKTHKSTTEKSYKYLVTRLAEDWLGLPLASITKDMVIEKYTLLADVSPGNANYLMAILKTVFYFAIDHYDEQVISINVVAKAFKTKSKIVLERRTNYIKPHQLDTWAKEVLKLQHETLRDYFLLLIFTGLRRREGITLKVSDIDFIDKTLCVRDTKNKVPLQIPLSDPVYQILKRRAGNTFNGYIFPSNKTRSGHIEDPTTATNSIFKKTNIKFTVHDLRRTFLTIADGLDMSTYTLKRLVNHKMSADVTSGYIIKDIDSLRVPVEKIATQILESAPTLKEHFNTRTYVRET